MKKILSIFAAALVAIAVNATILDIAPNSPQSSDNIRREIRDHINAGDTLRLADGVYTEADVVELNKSVVIMAADGAKPIVKQQYYMKLLGENTVVTIIGVKFDASLYPASDHCIRAYDEKAGKKLILENCEFVGWPSYILYSQRANRCIDELVIKNCYFHDNKRCAVYLGAEDGKSCNKVNIYGSTFANFTELQNPVIYVNNGGTEQADIEVRVDHCTFYNYMKTNASTYSAIDSRKSTDVVISNCIFAQPSAQEYGSTYCYGGTINNCLSFNTTGHRSSGVNLVDNIEGDPKFVDAANGDYTLGEGSPALTAAADGKAIGDPRWVPAAPAPTTKTIYLNDGVWAKADAARYEVYCITNESWVTLTAVADTNNLYSAEIPETVTQVVYCRMDPTKPEGQWSSLQNQTEDLTIPEGKDLFTITGWGEGWGAKCVGEWSKYGEAPAEKLEDGFYLVGKFGGVDAWDYTSLSADKKFVWNKTVGEGNEEWKVVADLVEGDKVKACYVYNGAITEYFPSGEGNEYVVDANHAGNGKTIYFQQLYNNEWGGHFYIDANGGETALDNIDAAVKTVKMIENGQMIIIKNGVKYNAQGAIVK